ncbi:hypothetical protein SLEP1_g19974 [Rubroshorea leprosula]|uniref:Helicase C-terminal domain-containing protein n=1 Tax=Rubroshorea leprosula TaxID=152421 RepID=A0AAV5JAA8_9ROSI|nr:hypothetical protein SLEP1_g19974 [Rubroshorea leprosula]
MANDSQSSRKTKTTPSSSTSSARKSKRLEKKNPTTTLSSARKSKRLEKKNPTTTPVRKSERIEKQKNPSPLRRSTRGKMLSSSGASGSKMSYKISDLSNMKRTMEKKEKKEKCVKRLTFETKHVDKNENPNEEPVKVNETRMDARRYKELFKKLKKRVNVPDYCEEPNKILSNSNGGDSGSNQVDDGIKLIERQDRDLVEDFTAKSGRRASESNVNQSPKKTLEDSDGHESSSTSLKHGHRESSKKTLADSVRHELSTTSLMHVNSVEDYVSLHRDSLHVLANEFVAKETSEDEVLENIQTPTSADSTLNERILDCDISLETGHMLSKRKRDTVDMVSDAPLMVGCKDMCTSMADSVTLLPSNCKGKDFVEMCHACFKKQRMGLDSLTQVNCSCETQSDNLFDSPAKETLAKHVANECKSESSRFIEYWVPVQISSVQLEQYCATLLENALSLCSPSRSDPVGVLRNTLISIRKCCDHPYLVDQSLQMLLTKDLKLVEYLDVGIKASGKLQILEAMLLETKKQGLRALILFQIGGSGRDAIGDIIDDFLRQRFGQDSYERIDSGLVHSKKQSALNKFNKENGRFVFLLETRACLPSIKLSSVDIVIMFNSDWNPMNDLRALQRITLDSQFEQIMIFRLYSAFTVEEKVLILSKQEKILDSIHSINPSTSQTLLMWGASYLFNKLNEFHDGSAQAFDTTILFEQSHLEEVLQEFLIIVTQNREDSDLSKLSLILHATPQVTYRTDFPLFGEQKIQVIDEDPPFMFWTKLLNGKYPQWKYSSNSSQRNRKRASVHHFDDFQEKPEAESGEGIKKRKKVGNEFVDSPFLKTGSEGQMVGQMKEGISGTPGPNLSHSMGRSTALVNDKSQGCHTSNSHHLAASHIAKIPGVNIVECEKRRKLRDSQKSLHALLKPDIAKLSEVLHLPENVRAMVESFLEYIMNNHHVTREPTAILQAFQISLCWTAAALLKHKINHKVSLELAQQHLNFGCKKEQADYVYSLLQCLKKMFLYHSGKLKAPNPPKASDLSTKCIGSEACNQQGVKDLKVSESSEKQALISQSELALEVQEDLLKSIEEIQKKCDKQMKKILQRQKEEMANFEKKYEEEKVELENKREMEAAVVRLHSTKMTKSDKLKKLDDEYAKKIDELERQRDIHLKSLEDMQVATRNKVRQRKELWVELVKSWAQNELGLAGCKTAISAGHDVAVEGMPNGEIGQDIPASLRDNLDNALSVRHLPQDQICDRSMLNMPDTNRLPEAVISGGGPEKVDSEKMSSSREQVPDGSTLRRASGEVPLGASEVVGETEGHKDIPLVTPSFSGDQNPDGATSTVPYGEALPSTPEIVSSSDGLLNVLPMNLASLKEKILDVSGSYIPDDVPLGAESETAPGNVEEGDNISTRHSLTMPDGEVPASTPEVAISSDTPDNVVSVNHSSAEEQMPDVAPCIPNGKVPLSESHFAPMELQDGDNASGENDGVSDNFPIRNSLSIPDGDVEARAPAVTAFCVFDRDIPLSDPESATREVREGGNAEKENNVAIGVDQQDGMVSSVNQEPPFPEASMVASSCISDPLSDPESATREIPEGGNSERENNTAIGVDQQYGIDMACSVNQEPQFPKASLTDSFQTQHAPALAQCNPLRLNQVEPGGRAPPSTGSELQAGDAVNIQTQSSSRVVEPSPSNSVSNQTLSQNDLGARVTELGALVQPSSSRGSPSNLNQLYELQPSNRGHLSQAPRHVSDTRTASTNHPIPAAPAVSSQTPLPYHDPLQNEMERINREAEQTVKIHEETKLQLKSDCDKEIEEIRRKYEIKLQKAETEFLLKKTELDANHNKVLMNKILADAFRLKIVESNFTGTLPEMGSDFMQLLSQLSPQQMGQRPSPVPGGTPPASLPAIISPALSVQTASPPVVTPRAMSLSLQAGYNPSKAFSGTPPRPPPHISSITPSTGNLQIGSEIRSPAPHLHPFRPSMSMPRGILPSLSRGVPIQQGHRNSLTPRMAPTVSQPGRAHIPATSGGLPKLPNPSVLNSIFNATNLSIANPDPPNTSPLDIGSNLTTPVQLQPSTPGMRSSTTRPSAAPGVVYLSDDD